MKKTITEAGDLRGKRVLVRADLNVPMDGGEVADDTRIRASLATIGYLREQQARIIVCSHLDRPKGEVREDLRLNAVADRMSELLSIDVKMASDCVGDEVVGEIEHLEPGQVLLLENTRFHPEEKRNDPEFARQLAQGADIFVNDAFATAHRAHASTEGVAHHLPSYAGLLMQRELTTLSSLLENPSHPYVAIMGGAKVSDKIGAVERLLPHIDVLLVGGMLASTLLKAKGVGVGTSVTDDEAADDVRDLIEKAGSKLVLPVDVMAATDISKHSSPETYPVEYIPSDTSIVDIGPETRVLFKKELEDAGTVVWNGPLGIAEIEQFALGTRDVLDKLTTIGATVVVGGGDTAAAVQNAGKMDAVSHVSTGGGAFLRFLQGKDLPGVAVLQDQ